mmetsp:Transcript_15898/g.18280  ORF Transcript_15898/g.18280 Transcript_15898/m.18280 type:complete len:306 (+) Transcript_15898:1-918(+)
MPSSSPSSKPSSIPSMNDCMYILNITDVSVQSGSTRWEPIIGITVANRNADAADDGYELKGTKVEATYAYTKGTKAVKPKSVKCELDVDGYCEMEESALIHFWYNARTGVEYAEFNVINIINDKSEYCPSYDEVETSVVAWDPVGSSAYPSLAPSITSFPSRGVLPSSSPSIDDAMYLKNISSVTEISDGGWTATFELVIDNVNPNAADTNYKLEKTKVLVQYIYGKNKKKRATLTTAADGTCSIKTKFLKSSFLSKGIESVELTVLTIVNKVSDWQPGLFDEVDVSKIAWDPGYISNSPSESVR